MENKQVILTAKGDYTKYQVQTTEIEAPKKGAVQIKILASGFAWGRCHDALWYVSSYA